MKEIKCLAEKIREELCDSENYGKLAMEYKDTDRDLGDTFYALSKEELDHADRLHAQAVRLIKEYDGTTPAGMKAVWEWEHATMVEKKAGIRQLQAMYKE